jgi:Xaa-Pro aminopeptidase
MSEQTVSAVLEYSGRQAGAEHAAFPPVVAGGPRATHIHYVANNQLLLRHHMLLVDSGESLYLISSKNFFKFCTYRITPFAFVIKGKGSNPVQPRLGEFASYYNSAYSHFENK